jgi:hypothetical protein
MIGQLTRAERAGERIVAITFLQVDAGSHPDLFGWLAERVYKEEPFVQYHAARAMLAICRVAEPSRIFEYTAIVKAASAVFKELPQDKRMEHPELFDWCLSSLQGRPAFNPAPLTPQTTCNFRNHLTLSFKNLPTRRRHRPNLGWSRNDYWSRKRPTAQVLPHL